MLHELNQASLKVGHSMNLWRPRLCTTSSLRTKTNPLSLTATKSMKSIITSTSFIAFPWIPSQRNKKSNIVSPSDDKLNILPGRKFRAEKKVWDIMEKISKLKRNWTRTGTENDRKPLDNPHYVLDAPDDKNGNRGRPRTDGGTTWIVS